MAAAPSIAALAAPPAATATVKISDSSVAAIIMFLSLSSLLVIAVVISVPCTPAVTVLPISLYATAPPTATFPAPLTPATIFVKLFLFTAFTLRFLMLFNTVALSNDPNIASVLLSIIFTATVPVIAAFSEAPTAAPTVIIWELLSAFTVTFEAVIFPPIIPATVLFFILLYARTAPTAAFLP